MMISQMSVCTLGLVLFFAAGICGHRLGCLVKWPLNPVCLSRRPGAPYTMTHRAVSSQGSTNRPTEAVQQEAPTTNSVDSGLIGEYATAC